MARTEGSDTWSALLTDERLFPAYQQHIKDNVDKDYRPDLNGYTREAKALHDLNVRITLLHRDIAKNMGIKLPPAPVFPAELLKEKADEAYLDDLFGDIYEAMGQPRPTT